MKCHVIPGRTQKAWIRPQPYYEKLTSLTFKFLRDDADIIWEWLHRFLIAIALKRKLGVTHLWRFTDETQRVQTDSWPGDPPPQ